MEKNNRLYAVCLNKKNINSLLEIICENIKLSQKSIPKCESMIIDIMKKNISMLTRHPKDNDELKKIAIYLNKLCINTIIEMIAKKFPDLHINKKKHISKEAIRREMDVYGKRNNHVQDRPYIRTRKDDNYDDDNELLENQYNMNINDDNYASAYSDHLITKNNQGNSMYFNNPPSNKNTNQFEQTYKQMMNERNIMGGEIQKPETPDFTLDGSGEKIKKEKMLRKMQNQTPQNDMNMWMGSANSCVDDIYGSLLGPPIIYREAIDNLGGRDGMRNIPAAPPIIYREAIDNLGGRNGMQSISTAPQIDNLGNREGMRNISAVHGAPMNMSMNQNSYLPNQMTNLMMQQQMNSYDTNMSMDNNQSVKSMELQSNYEKKLAERRNIDMETDQPQTTNYNTSNNNMGMLNMSNTLPNMMPMMNQMPTMMPNIMSNTMPNMMPMMNPMQNMMPIMPNMVPNISSL